MLKVAILEDEMLTAYFLKDQLEKYDCEVVGMASNIEEAALLLTKKIDLFFLDIRLDDDNANNKDGIIFAKELYQRNIPFLFISGNTEVGTTLKAAETQPLGYLTKPFNSNDIVASLSIMRARLEQKATQITLNGSFGKSKLSINDLLYIEADGAYVHLHTIKGKFTERVTLKKLMEELNHKDLARIHRSFAVNLIHVKEVAANQLQCGDATLPISDTYKEQFK